MSLAEEGDAREIFSELSEARVRWRGHASMAIRGEHYILTYHFDSERSALLRSKKKRVVIGGVEDSSITKKDLVIEKTECVEDKVEDVEEV